MYFTYKGYKENVKCVFENYDFEYTLCTMNVKAKMHWIIYIFYIPLMKYTYFIKKNRKKIKEKNIFSFQSFATKLILKTFVHFFKRKPIYFVEKF